VPIDVVQEVLGHSNINTTRKYAKTAPEKVFQLAAKIEEA
jgi:site-specific recombinase XerD